MTKWINGPIGIGSQQRRSRGDLRTVLVMVPHLVAGTRLMDFVPLLESDHRVEVVFTVPDAIASWDGAEDFVRAQGCFVLPWQQALQHRFDLVLDASRSDTDPANGPLLVTPHGAGALRSRLRPRKGGAGALPTHGLVREELIKHGRVIPSSLVLSTDEELDALRSSCPEALSAALVAGDLCLDRMDASRPFRQHYRYALGVREDQILVVISSTWSTESLFCQRLEMYRRAVDELDPDRYRVAAVVHPNVWTVHGRRQVRAWLSECTGRGMALLPPEEGWRGAMVAADAVLGDHGSTTQYAAAFGTPTRLATFPDDNVRRGGPAESLARLVPRYEEDRPLAEQIDETIATARPEITERMRALLTSRPGRSARILRQEMYRLLGLTEPTHNAPLAPVPLPRPVPAALSIAIPEVR
ncbi:hypothetical protein [Saccharopolyspora sp. 6M]|uniref:hypothetical protein n=1 Tax=Saccharopolyspora sp. 6M TaxID=2877237 RepID=UPI001CD6FA82|nr:hypothetical protein [Saccharopolyspora sp. 6M]MCA1228129.1 hypothetical protein [Saccharopolyspora sp. 6M]